MTYNSINNLTTNNNSSFNTDTPSEESIRSLDGRLWRCISKIENPLGGFLYQFKPREEITDFQKENLKGFPALELPPEVVSILNTYPLNKLGFLWNNETLQVPDPIAVKTLWEKLQKEQSLSPLPDFNITQSFNDIETDEDFIQFFLSDQIVISRGKEFLHDTILHLAPTLICMDRCLPHYASYRRSGIMSCKYIYDQIQNAKKVIQENPNVTDLTNDDITKLVFTLAAVIDQVTSRSITTTLYDKIILEKMKAEWNFTLTEENMNDDRVMAEYNYIHNRFGDAYFTGKSFDEVWEKVTQLNKPEQ